MNIGESLNGLSEGIVPSSFNRRIFPINESRFCDSFNESELKALCERTSVVISTVGPYALYGDLLIKVCAELGTDYCDLTGEVQWVRRMIAEYGETAKVSGARIINCCGFDSIPSDLGVKFLQQHALSNFGSYCEKVLMRVKASKGRPSGGTIASALNIYSEAAKNSDLRKELRDYYSLSLIHI